MTNDAGNLSIDFLAGFTIFLVAFIYVATLVPGLFVNLQSMTIDYDAVAYRTGVILVEDPGMPSDWDDNINYRSEEILRYGLATSKDTPNILSPQKVDQLFCSTWTYPNDYHTRAIFGDYPYKFNISFQLAGDSDTSSIGDVRPDGYGYIRRVVKLKHDSNATIGNKTITTFEYNSSANVTIDYFSIHLNCPTLLNVTDTAYQINPMQDPIMVNITDLNIMGKNYSTGYKPGTNLSNITIYISTPLPSDPSPLPAGPISYNASRIVLYVDGNKTNLSGLPAPVTSNVSLTFLPNFFKKMSNENSQVYIVLNFTHTQFEENYLNNTAWTTKSYYKYLNTSKTFDYDYKNTTPPALHDGVLEVSVW